MEHGQTSPRLAIPVVMVIQHKPPIKSCMQMIVQPLNFLTPVVIIGRWSAAVQKIRGVIALAI